MSPRYFLAAMALTIVFSTAAEARHQGPVSSPSPVTQFCGDRPCPSLQQSAGIRDNAPRISKRAGRRSAKPTRMAHGSGHAKITHYGPSYGSEAIEAVPGRPGYYYDGRVTGGRHPGDPYAFCGAEAARYVFGEAKRELWLAANWIRFFPRAQPAPGMAAARSGHVMILISHVDGSNWVVHDGNSGGHKTREHVRSIAGYMIVNPHGEASNYSAKTRHHRVHYAARR